MDEINEKTKVSVEVKSLIAVVFALVIYIYQLVNDVSANTQMNNTQNEIIETLTNKSSDQQMDITKLTEQLNAIKDNTEDLKDDVKYLIKKANEND